VRINLSRLSVPTEVENAFAAAYFGGYDNLRPICDSYIHFFDESLRFTFVTKDKTSRVINVSYAKIEVLSIRARSSYLRPLLLLLT
jgi:hypothetical protein